MHLSLHVTPATTKRLLLVIGIAATSLAATLAYAGVSPFTDNDTLTAKGLNDNFADLDKRLANLEKRSPAFTDWQRLPTPPTFTKVGGEALPLSIAAGNFFHDWRREGDSVHVRTCVTVSPAAAGTESIGMKLDGLPGQLVPDGGKISGPVRVGTATAASPAGYETCFALWLGNGPAVGLHCPTLGIVSADMAKGREICLDTIVPVAGWTSAGP